MGDAVTINPPKFNEPARVALGAAFLDEHFAGWYRRIKPARLRLESNEECVLGLLFGAYDEAKVRVIRPLLARHEEVEDWAYRYGFLGSSDHLKGEWIERIGERLEGRS